MSKPRLLSKRGGEEEEEEEEEEEKEETKHYKLRMSLSDATNILKKKYFHHFTATQIFPPCAEKKILIV